MKILTIHSDYLRFEPTKKAIKNAETVEKKKIEVKECLVVFTAVEKTDEANIENSAKKLVQEIVKILDQIKVKNIVLYPYAHLSSNLALPDRAIKVLKDAEKILKNKKYKVTRAPFGWYKAFEISGKGHPLSELSREFSIKGEEEKYDPKRLLKEISKVKLDTSKLKSNDHRILGQQMNLFSFNEVAPGMVFWHNNGWIIMKELIKFWRDIHKQEGYKEISTPQIMDKKLWQVSGHWEKYSENNFLTQYENRTFLVKPMNCPGGMLFYKIRPRSYKELPLKVGELGIVHRQELSGVLAGLFRGVQFTQDDAHIFCTETQMENEIIKVIDLVDFFYKKFKFSYRLELSTRPKKRIGSDKIWDKAEGVLKKVLKRIKKNYNINKGEGAFYGPKIDFHIKDSLGREWQCATIQLDFAMPERFDLTYEGKDGKKHRPVMLHRVIYGSIERFIGILLEHTNGRLPLWLAPIQIRVLSFTKKNIKSAKKVFEDLKKEGIRVEIDLEESPIAGRVRNAELQKIPYIVVVGDKEEKTKTLAVRSNNKIKFGVKKDPFTKKIKKEIQERK